MDLLETVLTAPRHGIIRLPDTTVIDRPDWFQISTPSLPQGGLNEVGICIASEADVERVIDETVAHYGERRFRWAVVPGSRPADLGERLEKRGFRGEDSWGMARETAPPMGAPADVEVVRVTEEPEYTQVMAEGWSMDPAPLAPLHRLALESGRHHLYVARVGGEPAGCAAWANAVTSAYFLSGVVLPRFRGRGVYRAMVAKRLADVHAAGIPLAVTHARAATSGPLLAHLGFETVATWRTYVNR